VNRQPWARCHGAALALSLAATSTLAGTLPVVGTMVESNKAVESGSCRSFNGQPDKWIRIVLSAPESRTDFNVEVRASEGFKWSASRADFAAAHGSVLSAAIKAREITLCTSASAPRITLTHVISIAEAGEPLSSVGAGPPSLYEAELFESAQRKYEPHPERLPRVLGAFVWLGVERLTDNAILSCSAFFLTDTLIATNQHCLEGDPDTLSVRGWWRSGPGASRFGAPDFQHLAIACPGDEVGGPDVALLRAKIPATLPQIHSTIPLVAGAKQSAPLVLIGFPGAERPLTLSYDEDCALGASGTDAAYRSRVTGQSVGPHSFVTHGCDSAPSSSGSPVLLRDLSGAVGIHYWGHPGDRDTDSNRAESTAAILEHVAERCPTVSAEIDNYYKELARE
jgi:hypothetical protein